jgi:predicted MPP superfamily phosphohydrolase
MPHLAPHLDGLRVLHLTDTHFGPEMRPVAALAKRLASHAYDLVVLTGDLAEDREGCRSLATLLAALSPRIASFAVLGNHDHFHYRHADGIDPQPNDLRHLLNALDGAGVQVLRNGHRRLFDGAFCVVGVDDPSLKLDNSARAFAGVAPGVATLLLAHSPDILVRLGRHRPGLVLAGHTHGGQLRLPGIGALGSVSVLPRRYAMGHYHYNGVQAFVSRGVGTSGAPFRLFCPPEASIITLRSPERRLALCA